MQTRQTTYRGVTLEKKNGQTINRCRNNPNINEKNKITNFKLHKYQHSHQQKEQIFKKLNQKDQLPMQQPQYPRTILQTDFSKRVNSDKSPSKSNTEDFMQFDDQKPKIQADMLTGIPNYGNTCHLNSILQFLHSIVPYRTEIIKWCIYDNTTVFKPVSSIFIELNKRNNQRQSIANLNKKVYMDKIVKYLETINFNYRRYQQEDAFETLNNMLNILEYPPIIEDYIKNWFIFQYTKCCGCMEYPLIEQTMFPSSFQTCSDCHSQYHLAIKYAPKYLMLTDKQVQQTFDLQDRRGTKMKYHFLSSIIYQGTGIYGHYVCIRFEDGRFYQISDSSVSQITFPKLLQKNRRQFRKPLCTAYKKLTPAELERYDQFLRRKERGEQQRRQKEEQESRIRVEQNERMLQQRRKAMNQINMEDIQLERNNVFSHGNTPLTRKQRCIQTKTKGKVFLPRYYIEYLKKAIYNLVGLFGVRVYK